MSKLDIKNYLYHGIVDWLNCNKQNSREKFRLYKLESILKCRCICRPCDFKKYGITHRDWANHYTYHFTFAACHPESVYAARFKKDIKEDNGYMVATDYSSFGILLDPRLLDELTICDNAICDREIVICDNVPIDEYGRGIYINPISMDEEVYQVIRRLIEKYNYGFDVFNIFDGAVVTSVSEEKEKVKKF